MSRTASWPSPRWRVTAPVPPMNTPHPGPPTPEPIPQPMPPGPPAGPDIQPPEIDDPIPGENPVPVREPPTMPTPMAS